MSRSTCHLRDRRARTAPARTNTHRDDHAAPETFEVVGPVNGPCSARWRSSRARRRSPRARPNARPGRSRGSRMSAGVTTRPPRYSRARAAGRTARETDTARPRTRPVLQCPTQDPFCVLRIPRGRCDPAPQRRTQHPLRRTDPAASGRMLPEWRQQRQHFKTSSTASTSTLPTDRPSRSSTRPTGEVIAHARCRPPRTSTAPSRPRAARSSGWSTTTPGERALALLKLADVIEEHADELAELESANAGKPIAPSATTRSRSWSTTCASSRAPRGAWRAALPASTPAATRRSSAASRSA